MRIMGGHWLTSAPGTEPHGKPLRHRRDATDGPFPFSWCSRTSCLAGCVMEQRVRPSERSRNGREKLRSQSQAPWGDVPLAVGIPHGVAQRSRCRCHPCRLSPLASQPGDTVTIATTNPAHLQYLRNRRSDLGSDPVGISTAGSPTVTGAKQERPLAGNHVASERLATFRFPSTASQPTPILIASRFPARFPAQPGELIACSFRFRLQGKLIASRFPGSGKTNRVPVSRFGSGSREN